MQENNNLTTENLSDYVNEALMPQPGESHDDYLTRGCRFWNIIQHHSDQVREDPILSGQTDEQIERFEEYLFKVVDVEVDRHARGIAAFIGRNGNMQDYYERARSALWEPVFMNLHKFNNPEHLKGMPPCRFKYFVRGYEKQAVNEIISEDRGLKSYVIKRMNHINASRARLVQKKAVCEEMITAEEIYEDLCSRGIGGFSVEIVRDTLPHMYLRESLEGVSEESVKHTECGYQYVENATFEKDMDEVFDKLRPLQQLVILKKISMRTCYGAYEMLAKDPMIIELCRNDEHYGAKYEKAISQGYENGNIKAMAKLMETIYTSSQKLLNKYIKAKNLYADDLCGWLDDWICRKLDEHEGISSLS